MLALALALVLAGPGDASFRANVGKLIPVHGEDSVRLLAHYAAPPLVGAYPSGSPTVFAGAIAVRNGTAIYVTEDGSLEEAAANQIRVETDGVLIETEGTNYHPHSGSTCTALNTVVAGVGLGTNYGSCNLSGVSAPLNTGSDWYTLVQATAWGGTLTLGPVYSLDAWDPTFDRKYGTASVWVRAVAGSQFFTLAVEMPGAVDTSCKCGRSDNGSCTATMNPGIWGICWVTTTVGTSPVRVWATGIPEPGGSLDIDRIVYYPGNMLDGTQLGSVYIWGRQVEPGDLSSYIPTGATALTRAADQSYLENTVLPHTAAKWCVRSTVKPSNAAEWSARTRAVWSLGSHGAANSAMQVVSTAGNLDLTHVDGSTASASYSGAHNLAPVPVLPAGNGKQIAGSNLPPGLSESIDGAPVAGAAAGAGSRTWNATPDRIYFGSTSVPGYEFGGYVKDWSLFGGACQ